MKIAIIGTGIAGLGAAYVLSRLHDVELFEANGHARGHANTVTHDSRELDTGFIVHNEANYPNLKWLLREFGYNDRFLRIWTFYLAFCEAGFAIRSLRDMQIVLTHSANDSLPEFPSVRSGY
jgi:phytoene dehydrogenase-like protein